MNKFMSTSEKIFYGFIVFLLIIICVVMIYPMLYVVSASFSNPLAVMRNEVILWPKGFTILAYKKVFQNPDIWRSYANTVAYTVVGTAFGLLMTAIGAFPLSRRDLYGRNFWTIFFTFTMFFSGGMIPTYLLIKNLGLLNTFWVMVIPGAVSTWNLIVMRTFFQSDVPMELQEATLIDGGNDLQIFFKIVLPLSKPVLAVMTIFYGVGHWNAFFNALLYLSDRSKYPLQLILREILLQNTMTEMVSGPAADQQIMGEGVRYATIIVATVPILCIYPFLQKYFVKGVLIGAIKG